MPPPPDQPHITAGPWVESWLSSPRFDVYVQASGGDRTLGLSLYEWNARLSAALAHDLGHLEVGLRNAYDRALTTYLDLPRHWTRCGPQVFAPIYRRHKHRERGGKAKVSVDVNANPRASLERAVHEAGGADAPPGKVIAQLSFGFWRYLTSSAHEVSLWRPALHQAFPPGTSRPEVDTRVGRLHELRNRVAHHEPLMRRDVRSRQDDVLELAGLLSPELRRHIAAQTAVDALLENRP